MAEYQCSCGYQTGDSSNFNRHLGACGVKQAKLLQAKVALQSEVTPEAKRSKRCSNERSKRIAATLVYLSFIVARLRRLFRAEVCTHFSRHNRVRSLCSAIRTHSTDSPLASIYSRSFIGDGIEAATLAGTLNRTLPVRAA